MIPQMGRHRRELSSTSAPLLMTSEQMNRHQTMVKFSELLQDLPTYQHTVGMHVYQVVARQEDYTFHVAVSISWVRSFTRKRQGHHLRSLEAQQAQVGACSAVFHHEGGSVNGFAGTIIGQWDAFGSLSHEEYANMIALVISRFTSFAKGFAFIRPALWEVRGGDLVVIGTR